MRTLQILALLGVATYASSQNECEGEKELKELDEKFSIQIAKNGTQIYNHYEYELRKSQFKKATEQVQNMNQISSKCSFSTNSLAVLLPVEINSMLVQIDFADSSIRGNYKDLKNSTTNDEKEKQFAEKQKGEVKACEENIVIIDNGSGMMKAGIAEKGEVKKNLNVEKKNIKEKVDDDKGDDGKVEEGKENVEEYEDESKKFYINWAELGKVSPVKPLTNPCALSWAQAASLVLESKIAIQNSTKPEPLSMQQILDCFEFYNFTDYADRICDGGTEMDFWKFSGKYGSKAEQDYPYNGKINAKDCEANQSDVVARAGKYRQLKDVAEMKSAIKEGPFTVAFDATQSCFQYYQKGIVTSKHCEDPGKINYIATVVGYVSYLDEKRGESAYWLMQNQWGTGWGENGFIKIEVEEGDGVLSMNTRAYTVDVQF